MSGSSGPEPTSKTFQDAAARLVIAAIHATRSILTGETSVSGQSASFIASATTAYLPQRSARPTSPDAMPCSGGQKARLQSHQRLPKPSGSPSASHAHAVAGQCASSRSSDAGRNPDPAHHRGSRRHDETPARRGHIYDALPFGIDHWMSSSTGRTPYLPYANLGVQLCCSDCSSS